MATQSPASLSVSTRFPLIVSASEDPSQRPEQQEADVERRGQKREQHRVAARPRAALVHAAAAGLVRPLLVVSARRRHHIAHLTTGGVSNVWCGAGDGTVHSSPSAPSHGLSPAGAPPRADLITTQTKISCARPKPNAPMLETMLKSANCTA